MFVQPTPLSCLLLERFFILFFFFMNKIIIKHSIGMVFCIKFMVNLALNTNLKSKKHFERKSCNFFLPPPVASASHSLIRCSPFPDPCQDLCPRHNSWPRSWNRSPPHEISHTRRVFRGFCIPWVRNPGEISTSVSAFNAFF